ncbi:Cof-type HAD-IIB family hydrolase [Erwinia amylovora]|uniref:Cof-type HAD-IIB family hydrolase n=1 Tax=Erwinia amylovora TaxID=552 RepID=UPI000C07AF95|nr:Cof-type HAD-IIB family hydrolase [Erwinia amylovora]MBZ2399666.1 Cof-type HAD-IIB family hydrolase [Erwinia amylovora]MBZ2403534.1 Cof-type HAD-IIB family hydrolase [Erwinia amylovora]
MIKMIAVDMDGTFLDDKKTYNKARFLPLYQQLKQRDIKLVVASGNQYYQLISFFPEICGEIAFVAENGANIVDKGNTLFCAKLSDEHLTQVLTVLQRIPYAHAVVCGPRCAYMLNDTPDVLLTLMSKHYHRLELRENFECLNDTIFKFSLNLADEKIPELMDHVGHSLDGIVTPVSSGSGFVDLIIPGVHKAHGLSLLQKQWQIADHEVVAIGDSGNDIEMLAHAGYGFAMANAQPAVKQVAGYHTDSNNHQGALNVIERVLTQSAPFAR